MNGTILEPMALLGRQDISREQMHRLIAAAPEMLELLQIFADQDATKFTPEFCNRVDTVLDNLEGN